MFAFSLPIVLQLNVVFPIQYEEHIFECKIGITSSFTVALCYSVSRLDTQVAC